MNKKLNIFGRKVPVLAVMMVLLVIGTASAALIVNYATLSGTFEVGETIGVTVTDAGDLTKLDFETDGVGVFTINNADTGVVNASVVTTLLLDQDGEGNLDSAPVSDTEGITIIYDIDTDNTEPYTLVGLKNQLIPDQVIPIASGDNVVTVTFEGNPDLEIGVYTIQVAVNPVTTST